MQLDWNVLFSNLPDLREPVRFSLRDRRDNLRRLREERFDVLVVGGGFNGCAVAAELATQGLSVALVERGDFCSETSMASGIVLWGGIKYLANLDWGLVRSSCIERNRFLRRAPHIVREREFFSPVYEGDPYRTALRWTGTWIHFLLGGAWWGTREPRLYRCRDAALRKDPRLRAHGLEGGVSYWDTELETSDAHLGLSLAMTAAAHGAVLVPRCRLEGFLFNGERIEAARCRDQVSGHEFSIRAAVVVNACGPWADRVNSMAAWETSPHEPALRRGTFLIVNPDLFDCGRRGGPPPDHALTIFSSRDQRPLFFYPWGPRFIAGTTDIHMSPENLESIETTLGEFGYLQREIPNRLRLSEPLRTDTFIESRVGVRPLAVRRGSHVSGDGRDALSISRRHEIDIHFERGLLTIVGGKLTPAREMAEEVGRAILHHWPEIFRGKSYLDTAEKPVYGAEEVRTLKELREWNARESSFASPAPDIRESLVAQWGEHAGEPLTLMRWYPDLRERVYPDLPYTWADLVHNVRNRMVFSLDDLLRRRTNIAQWIPRGGLGKRGEYRMTVARIAALVATGTGISETSPEELLGEYEDLVRRRNRWRDVGTLHNEALPPTRKG
jgi:glycerol-3-phosphate dehydrogenase